MLIKDIIKMLQDQGHQVSYRIRREGSPLITAIDGVHYIGAKGNEQARALTGQALSFEKIEHLKRIKPPKGFSIRVRQRKTKLPEELEKELRKAQYYFRKNKTAKNGRITKSNVRYTYETYGYKEAKRRISRAISYAKGYAYDDNVRALISRLKSALKYTQAYNFNDSISLLEQHLFTTKEKAISEVNNVMYELEIIISNEKNVKIIFNKAQIYALHVYDIIVKNVD